MNISIEVFPAEKTCEQGCSTCPLARKGSDIIASKVDSNVQTTFSFLEMILARDRYMYDIHTGSAPHLMIQIAYPELIRMARFETDTKEIRTPSGPRQFSDRIQTLLGSRSINPKIVGFSLVPELPIVSTFDVDIIREILNNLSNWYFEEKNKIIEITLRSNLIEKSKFENVIPHLFKNDNLLLKPFMQENMKLWKFKRKPAKFSTCDADVYFNKYISSKSMRRVMLTNRVIARPIKNDTSYSYYHKQAIEMHRVSKVLTDFAVAPRGVMLMHTSTAINNPIMWMSHGDFRAALAIEANRSGFTPTKFVQTMIQQNDTLYKRVINNNLNPSVLETPSILERLRYYFLYKNQKQNSRS